MPETSVSRKPFVLLKISFIERSSFGARLSWRGAIYEWPNDGLN